VGQERQVLQLLLAVAELGCVSVESNEIGGLSLGEELAMELGTQGWYLLNLTADPWLCAVGGLGPGQQRHCRQGRSKVGFLVVTSPSVFAFSLEQGAGRNGLTPVLPRNAQNNTISQGFFLALIGKQISQGFLL